MRTLPLSAICLCFALLTSCDGCDEANANGLTGLLSPNVTTIDFGDVFVGTTQTRTLTLSSLGTGTVLLDNVDIERPFGSDVDLPYSMNPGELFDVDVFVAPLVEGEAEAQMRWITDADNARTLEIQLRVNALPRPPCDDDNECTTDTFDEGLGTCVYAFRQGPCDDNNLCTQDDRCSDGTCVGELLSCDDGIECTINTCNPEEGCAFIGNESACDDEQPCTLDTCSANGCVSEPAPDYTVCGEIESCVAAEVCIAQACTSIDIPDGVPCSDNDACTIDDTCQEGFCVGEVSQEQPGIVETRLLSAPLTRNVLRRGDFFFDHSTRAIEFSEDTLIPRMIPALARASRLHELDGRYAIVNRFAPNEGTSSIVDFIDPLHPIATSHSNAQLMGGDDTMVWGCENGEVVRHDRLPSGQLGASVVIGACLPTVEGAGRFAYRFTGSATLVYEVRDEALFEFGLISERVINASEKIWHVRNSEGDASLIDIVNFSETRVALPSGYLQAIKNDRLLWRDTTANATLLYRHTGAGIEGPTPLVLENNQPALHPGYVDDTFVLISPIITGGDEDFQGRAFMHNTNNLYDEVTLQAEMPSAEVTSRPIMVSNDEVLFPAMNNNPLVFSLSTLSPQLGPNGPNDQPSLVGITRTEEPSAMWQFGEALETVFGSVATSQTIASTSLRTASDLTSYYALPQELSTISYARGEGCGFFAAAVQGQADGIAHIDRCLDTNANIRSLALLAFTPFQTSWVTDIIDHENHVTLVDFVAPGSGRTALHLFELTSPTSLVHRTSIDSTEACNGSRVDQGLWLTHTAADESLSECELTLREVDTMNVLDTRAVDERATLLAFEYPIALMAFEERVEFIDVRSFATLSTFDLPNAGYARFQDDIVYVHHDGGVTLISPPCGP